MSALMLAEVYLYATKCVNTTQMRFICAKVLQFHVITLGSPRLKLLTYQHSFVFIVVTRINIRLVDRLPICYESRFRVSNP